eukprot:TRINITY_DN32639_c0_g1_i1.p1 TRINITY_DN32639_c0_g1~~TRINITY_DN32639_c0_g1_i1.p1  ORF type:complete len:303 (-),score=46.74 TRINITY_DN32639_c0_g1_i1:86-994(-)
MPKDFCHFSTRRRWCRFCAVTTVGLASYLWSLDAANFIQNCWSRSARQGAINAAMNPHASRHSRSLIPRSVNAEDIEVWDQPPHELALDVRELLVTDGNMYFVGPDIDTYKDAIREVSQMINYTHQEFDFANLRCALEVVSNLERVFTIPPVLGVQRWPWKLGMTGLVIWIDPDGWTRKNAEELDYIRKKKFPSKKSLFGPTKATEFTLNKPTEKPPGDPIDMWQEADVHVDLKAHPDMPISNLIMASIIDAILKNPPKWRGWMQAAKDRGTIASDYQTPLQERRSFHSNGISPRLQKLLKA